MSAFQIFCWGLLGVGLVALFISVAALAALIAAIYRDPPEDWQ